MLCGVTVDRVHFYTAIVWPVLEYTCLVWHSGLTARQSKAFENIQKHTIRIIYGEGDYKTALTVAGVDSLKNRHETVMARFFKRQILANNALLHYLLSERRDETIRSLRNSQPFHSIRTRTNKLCKSNLFCPTVWTTSHSHCNLFKESHLTIVIKQCYFNFRPHRVHGIQAVAIDDPVDYHPDCHTGGLYKNRLDGSTSYLGCSFVGTQEARRGRGGSNLPLSNYFGHFLLMLYRQ